MNDTFSLNHKDYFTYRLDRGGNTIGGGVAICVRKGISHTLLPHLNLEVIESLGIKIHTSTGEIELHAVYYPGTSYSTIVFEKFRKDIKTLTNRRNSFFICGDLNSKHVHWNCVRNNKAGQILFDEMNYSNYIIDNPPTPTYFSHQANPSTLDIILTNNQHQFSPLQAHQELSSDHLPVTFQIYLNGNTTPTNEALHWRYDKADWKKYKDFIGQNIDLRFYSNPQNLNSKIKIDEAIEKLTNLMLAGEKASVPQMSTRHNDTNDLEFSDHLKQLVQLRNTSRRRWQRTRLAEFKLEVNRLNVIIHKEIQELRNKRWDNTLKDITPMNNNQKLWNISKILRKKSKGLPTLRKASSGPLYSSYILTDVEKAEALADNFSSVYCNRPDTASTNTKNLVADSITELDEMIGDEIKSTSPREIYGFIRILKNKKSPGQDLINNKILKQIPKKAIVLLTYIFNSCLKLSYFPDAWKHAKVIAIHKPGKDSFDPKSYRPISLLSSIGKLFEKIILNQLNHHIHCSDQKVIPDEQFGFRRNHSTNHQLFRVTSFVKSELNFKKSVGLVLFDIEKAFDGVWHDALIHKMKSLGFPVHIIKLVRSFLSNRSFAVNVNNSFSSTRHVPSGVPQGAVMSPTLYNIYTNDLPISVKGNDCEVSQFADDTAIYTSSACPDKVMLTLEESLLKLSNYCIEWNIKLNADKTKAIYFTRKRAERFLPQRKIKFHDSEIDWSDSVKYLGLHLDKKLLYKYHIDSSIEKAQRIFRMLYPLINRRSKLSSHHKLLVFKCILRPAFIYGSPVWSVCANTHIKKLQIYQNKCLKTIFNLPRRYHTDELHTNSNMSMIADFINLMNGKFKATCDNSTNPLINQIDTLNF